MTDATPSSMLRDAAHELNNLCSTILGFATLAEDADPKNSTITAYVTEIKLSTESVAAVAKRLRELSQELGTPSA